MSKLVLKQKSETVSNKIKGPHEKLKVIIADDEKEVHSVTRFALKDYKFNGKKLEFISAYSGEEAKKLLREHTDTSLVLLDIVMEEDDSGLQIVEYIRGELNNKLTRIILRTGQPGMAPEKDVIFKYDVNDYKEKADLTNKKFITALTMALRSYSDIMEIEIFRQALEEKVKERTIELHDKNKKLVQINLDKNVFLEIVARDFKNPLARIDVLAEAITRDYDTLAKEEILSNSKNIDSSAKSMLTMVDKLLDVNAIESEKRKK